MLRTAKDQKADLILIATHGGIGLARAFLGSTAARVIRLAPCPVLVVRLQPREKNQQPSRNRKLNFMKHRNFPRSLGGRRRHNSNKSKPTARSTTAPSTTTPVATAPTPQPAKVVLALLIMGSLASAAWHTLQSKFSHLSTNVRAGLSPGPAGDGVYTPSPRRSEGWRGFWGSLSNCATSKTPVPTLNGQLNPPTLDSNYLAAYNCHMQLLQ